VYLFGDLAYKLEGTRLYGDDVYIALGVQTKGADRKSLCLLKFWVH